MEGDQSLLEIAVWSNNLTLLDLVLEHQNFDPTSPACRRAFRAAYGICNNLAAVKRLLRDPRVNPDDGGNSLICAVTNHRVKLLKVLLRDSRMIICPRVMRMINRYANRKIRLILSNHRAL